MAFRCESDDSDNELTAMQEEVIQPYQLEPVVEVRRIDLSLCGGHRLLVEAQAGAEGRIGNTTW